MNNNIDYIQLYKGSSTRKKVLAYRQESRETIVTKDAIKNWREISFNLTQLESQRDSKYKRVCSLSLVNALRHSPTIDKYLFSSISNSLSRRILI